MTIKTAFAAMESRLLKLPAVGLGLVLLLATYLIFLPVSLLAIAFPEFDTSGQGPRAFDDMALHWKLLWIAFLVPLQETVMFQWAPIRLLQGVFEVKRGWAILVSAVLFGATHFYSWSYVCFATLVGLVLGYGFVLASSRPGFRPVWLITCVHGARNAMAVVFATFM